MERSGVIITKKVLIKGVKLPRKKKFFFLRKFRLKNQLSLSQSSHDFEVPFKHMFSPTSQSRMFNIFRDSEALVRCNGKKWSHNKKIPHTGDTKSLDRCG